MLHTHRRRVLIIDDERGPTEALAIRLSSCWSFTVAVAHGGDEGLRKSRVLRPDVILLNVAAPNDDCWALCRRLREDPAARSVPIVIMAPWSTAVLDKRAADAGATKILVRTAGERDLLAVLRTATRDGRQAEAHAAAGPRPDPWHAQRRRPHPRGR